jgi:hypothetical protein
MQLDSECGQGVRHDYSYELSMGIEKKKAGICKTKGSKCQKPVFL